MVIRAYCRRRRVSLVPTSSSAPVVEIIYCHYSRFPFGMESILSGALFPFCAGWAHSLCILLEKRKEKRNVSVFVHSLVRQPSSRFASMSLLRQV